MHWPVLCKLCLLGGLTALPTLARAGTTVKLLLLPLPLLPLLTGSARALACHWQPAPGAPAKPRAALHTPSSENGGCVRARPFCFCPCRPWP